MKKNVLFLALLFVAYCSYSQTTVNSGNVQGTWNKAGSPYLINGDIAVAVGQKLTITEGVKVEFQGAYRLHVYGSIQVLGKIGDTAIFTAKDKNVGWKGIDIHKNATTDDSILFNYMKFEYVKDYNYNFGTSRGSLRIDSNSKVLINHSLFQFNKATFNSGIYLKNCKFSISNTQFHYNEAIDDRTSNTVSAGACMRILNSQGLIENTNIENNKCWAPNNVNDSTTGQSGAICNFYECEIDVQNCEISNNYCSYYGMVTIAGKGNKINFSSTNLENNSSREGKAIECTFENNGNNSIVLKNCRFTNNQGYKVSFISPHNDIYMYSKNAFSNILKVSKIF